MKNDPIYCCFTYRIQLGLAEGGMERIKKKKQWCSRCGLRLLHPSRQPTCGRAPRCVRVVCGVVPGICFHVGGYSAGVGGYLCGNELDGAAGSLQVVCGYRRGNIKLRLRVFARVL